MKYDVAVIGAGPAGAIAARELARSGRRVALVDDPQAPLHRIGESLPGAARPLLRSLGLLEIVDSGAHRPSTGNLIAWGKETTETTDFIRDPHGLGWHLDRTRFDSDLRKAAVQSGAEWTSGKVSALERGANFYRIETEESTLCASWIIDATGRNASIARKLGATVTADDTLMAAYAWAKANDRDNRTLVESAADGWWYTSLLPGGKRVFAFHSAAETVGRLTRDAGAWMEKLEATSQIAKRFSGEELSEIKSTQAWGARLDQFSGEGWLAVGDAALAFDPLSSQGIFNAIYTGMRGAQAVQQALQGNRGSLVDYSKRLESIRAAYLESRRYFYTSERRWPESPFWTAA